MFNIQTLIQDQKLVGTWPSLTVGLLQEVPEATLSHLATLTWVTE